MAQLIIIFIALCLVQYYIRRFRRHLQHKREEKTRREEQRRKLLQSKILNIVHTSDSPVGNVHLYDVLEPLGFSEQEIRRERAELASEGKIKLLR